MSGSEYKLVVVKTPSTAAELCQQNGLPYSHGCGFYELQASEGVSESKVLVACHEESDEVVAGGPEVRAKLRLGSKAKIAPKDLPKGWTLYVGSTSPNRKFKAGTAMIRLDVASGAVKASNMGASAEEGKQKQAEASSKKGRNSKRGRDDDDDDDDEDEDEDDDAKPLRQNEIPPSFFARDCPLRLQLDPGESVFDSVGEVQVDVDDDVIDALRERPGALAAVAALIRREARAQGPWHYVACASEDKVHFFVPAKGSGFMIYQEDENVAALQTKTQALLIGQTTAMSGLCVTVARDEDLELDDWDEAEENPDKLTPDMIVDKFLEMHSAADDA